MAAVGGLEHDAQPLRSAADGVNAHGAALGHQIVIGGDDGVHDIPARDHVGVGVQARHVFLHGRADGGVADELRAAELEIAPCDVPEGHREYGNAAAVHAHGDFIHGGVGHIGNHFPDDGLGSGFHLPVIRHVFAQLPGQQHQRQMLARAVVIDLARRQVFAQQLLLSGGADGVGGQHAHVIFVQAGLCKNGLAYAHMILIAPMGAGEDGGFFFGKTILFVKAAHQHRQRLNGLGRAAVEAAPVGIAHTCHHAVFIHHAGGAVVQTFQNALAILFEQYFRLHQIFTSKQGLFSPTRVSLSLCTV